MKPAIFSADSHGNTVELLSFLLEHSTALVSFKSLDGRYVYANPELEHTAGVSKGGLVGRRDHDFFPPPEAQALVDKDRWVAKHGKAERSIDRIGENTLAAVRFPQLDDHGEIVGIGCVAINISCAQNDSALEFAELKQAREQITELHQALDELKSQAFTDPVSGALSRIRMEQALQDETQRFQRYSQEAALIFIDLDHFKQINDTLGHAAGDKTLQQLTQIARECLRNSDLLGRWGGEEFLVLLPNTDLTQARLLAEKIRSLLGCKDRDERPLATASFGVAQIQPGESWQSWVARADSAMYLAKKNGRNRVEVDYGHHVSTPDAVSAGRHFVHLVWNPCYECGHTMIDKQHRALFEGANSMVSAMMDEWPVEEIRQGMEFLLADVVSHFRDEEELLSRIGYPDVAQHAKIHANLIAKAQAMAGRLSEGQECLGETFHLLVYEIIAKHMLTEDRRFFPFFANPGH